MRSSKPCSPSWRSQSEGPGSRRPPLGVRRQWAPRALVLFVVFVLGPVLLVLFDVVVVIALGVGGVVARLLFRRPWTVEAVAEDDGTEHHFQAVGLAASRRLRDDVADRLAHGQSPDDLGRV